MGMIYTGAFIVWRNFLKFLDWLEQSEVFTTQKGRMLENYVFNLIKKHGFEVNKIILKIPKSPH